jgi:hypothetical protein
VVRVIERLAVSEVATAVITLTESGCDPTYDARAVSAELLLEVQADSTAAIPNNRASLQRARLCGRGISGSP